MKKNPDLIMSESTSSQNSIIRPYEPSDLPQIIEIVAEVYGQDIAKKTEQRWQWQYHESPLSKEQGHAVNVLVEGDVIQSVIGGMRQTFNIEGEKIEGIWLIDFMARPTASTRAGMRLAKSVTGLYPICLGQNSPTLNRYWRVVLKGNSSDISKPAMMIKPLSVSPAIPQKYRDHALLPLLKVVSKNFIRAFYAEQGELKSQYTFNKVEHFDERCDILWSNTKNHFQAIATRDMAYINWRYCQSPLPYECFQLEKDGELMGWVVGRQYKRDGLIKARIVDFMVKPNDQHSWNQLFTEICQYYRQHNVDLIQIINSQEASVKKYIEDNGFKPHTNESRLSPYIATAHIDHHLYEKINDPELCWHMSYGDTDLDFY